MRIPALLLLALLAAGVTAQTVDPDTTSIPQGGTLSVIFQDEYGEGVEGAQCYISISESGGEGLVNDRNMTEDGYGVYSTTVSYPAGSYQAEVECRSDTLIGYQSFAFTVSNGEGGGGLPADSDVNSQSFVSMKLNTWWDLIYFSADAVFKLVSLLFMLVQFAFYFGIVLIGLFFILGELGMALFAFTRRGSALDKVFSYMAVHLEVAGIVLKTFTWLLDTVMRIIEVIGSVIITLISKIPIPIPW